MRPKLTLSILATVSWALSADARILATRYLSEEGLFVGSDALAGKKLRRLAGASTTAATDDTTTTVTDDTADDDTVSSGGQKSIASRTSRVPPRKKDDLLETSMSAHFVKPETAAPSVAPPTPPTTQPKETTKPATAKKTNSTSTTSDTNSTSTSDSSPSPADTATKSTMYPTKADSESIASHTSNADSSGKVPLSASMEFETAETASPVASNSTKLYSMQTNTTVKATTNTTESTDANEDDYIPMNGTDSAYSDDLVTTYSPQNETSSSDSWIFPKEKKQSDEWPGVVGAIFIVAAIAFFGATAFKNYRKRRDYEKIPVSLSV